ncbi:MAG: mevalonate kinase [Candidatus Thorarchaeota archaeon]
MAVGSGKGKAILFGEHFVVYGRPALAAGISAETIATVHRTSTPGWKLEDLRPEVPGYKKEKADEQTASIDNIIRYMGIDLSEKGIHIQLSGDLVCASGIGASAASCVAIARALNEEFDLNYDDEKINLAAYEGEKGYHGTPSGIDNTASTFGGLVWYQKPTSSDKPVFEVLKLKRPLNLVIAATGLTSSTKAVVDDVRRLAQSDRSWFDNILQQYDRLIVQARDALLELDKKRVGKLMNENHRLLQQLTVSCPELDTLVDTAIRRGAVGAKLTGTGRGGNMIALTDDEKGAQVVAGALREAGATDVWVTSFGV